MDNNISANKTEIKKLQKKKSLIKAGAKVFSEKGFINSSIKNITDEADVAVGTFYSYFKSKEEVLEQIYDDLLEESIHASSEIASSIKNADSILEKFTMALTGAVLTYAKNKEASRIVLVKGAGINETLENKRFQLIDKTNEYIEHVLIHLKNDHSIKIYDVKMTSIMITHSILGLITYWIDDKVYCSIEDMIFELCIYVLNAINIHFDEDAVKSCINSVLDYENK